MHYYFVYHINTTVIRIHFFCIQQFEGKRKRRKKDENLVRICNGRMFLKTLVSYIISKSGYECDTKISRQLL